MSATEKLLTNINEYQELLEFLHKKHPEVLEEWSNGPQRPSPTGTTHTNDQEGRIDNE